jgi:hypothetical protein
MSKPFHLSLDEVNGSLSIYQTDNDHPRGRMLSGVVIPKEQLDRIEKDMVRMLKDTKPKMLRKKKDQKPETPPANPGNKGAKD